MHLLFNDAKVQKKIVIALLLLFGMALFVAEKR